MSDAIKKLEDAKHHMDAHDYYDCRIAIDAAIAALQQSGEPVGQVYFTADGAIDVNWFDANKLAEDDLLYTTPQPVVPEGYVLVPVKATREIEDAIAMSRNLKAAEIWEDALSAALLSAGKETDNAV